MAGNVVLLPASRHVECGMKVQNLKWYTPLKRLKKQLNECYYGIYFTLSTGG